mmetsp:Transcript_21006/g.64879  ORF Transcript_21006/g.64879 Transcript_21006/m.64879 type:complete len:222 (-) Transcript_21006:72-737(-)
MAEEDVTSSVTSSVTSYVWSLLFGREGEEKSVARVQNYWKEDGDEPRDSHRRRERTSAELFATEELDEAELAELGRALARTGPSVEQRGRGAREFVEETKRRRREPEAPAAAAKNWKSKLDSLKAELRSDKRRLGQRQKQRAAFLLSDRGGELARAKERQKASKTRLLSYAFASSSSSTRSRRRADRDGYDPDFPPPPDDDEIEQRAVVDLFWKGHDDHLK